MEINRIDSILAQAKQLSQDELSQIIQRVGELLEPAEDQHEVPDYLQFFGAGKGAFSSPEEVDRFIRAERDAWDS